MANPVANLQRTAAEYRQMDKKDKRRFWSDGILNNALYILMLVHVLVTKLLMTAYVSKRKETLLQVTLLVWIFVTMKIRKQSSMQKTLQ